MQILIRKKTQKKIHIRYTTYTQQLSFKKQKPTRGPSYRRQVFIHSLIVSTMTKILLQFFVGMAYIIVFVNVSLGLSVSPEPN